MKQNKRTKVKRTPTRAVHDVDKLYQLLDSSWMAHIGFIQDYYPVIIPMICWRVDHALYFHAATNSRFADRLRAGHDICVAVTAVDGLVLAKSAMHHSANYRSAVIFGKPQEIATDPEILKLSEILIERIEKGRWQQVRPPNHKELALTTIFSLPLDEASLKIREGGPSDLESDLALPVWAGVISLK